ncbi:hypothetical protein Agub_g13478 [Astrephomene gubernaculifera]|uniref:Uncharacterized protein n=1 Tax=Astrephomene gubernaculifera TaxID=47775 RepID=A0AAD3HSM9_9CHLO|nr:hypothetical protein Agub_g13478 [Astrephomene gubernaculifera]
MVGTNQLPDHIQSALPWMSWAASQLLSSHAAAGDEYNTKDCFSDASSVPFDASQLLMLDQCLRIPDSYVVEQASMGNGATAAVTILSHDDFRVPFQSIIACAFRWPMQGPSLDTGNAVVAALRQQVVFDCSLGVNNIVLSALLAGRPPEEVVHFIHTLLKMHTLHCCSRLLSTTTGPFVPAHDLGNADREGITEERVLRLSRSLQLTIQFLYSLVVLATERPGPQHQQRYGGGLPYMYDFEYEYARALAEALNSSCLLEHAARAVVLLAELAGLTQDDSGTAVAMSLPMEAQGQLSYAFSFLTATLSGLTQLAERCHETVGTAASASMSCGSPAVEELGPPAAVAEAAAAARSHLLAALSGPCVRHMLLSATLAALCAADGGPSYGLPAPLLLGMLPSTSPIDDAVAAAAGAAAASASMAASGYPDAVHVRAARHMYGKHQLDDRILRCLPAVLMLPSSSSSLAAAAGTVGTNCQPPPPRPTGPQPRQLCRLMLRVGRLAVASGRAWSGPTDDAAVYADAEIMDSSLDPPHGHLVLSPQSSCSVALAALRCSRRSLAPSCPDANWWRVTTSAVRHLVPWVTEEQQLSELAALLRVPLDSSSSSADPWVTLGESSSSSASSSSSSSCFLSSTTATLPATPPPAVAAALSGGLIPCIELLFRRAGETPSSPEARLLLRLLRPDRWRDGQAVNGGGASGGGCGSYLGCLLSYGEVRQAAALVATMGKVLRRLEGAVVEELTAAAAVGGGGDDDDVSSGGDAAAAAAAELAEAVIEAMYDTFLVCAGKWLMTACTTEAAAAAVAMPETSTVWSHESVHATAAAAANALPTGEEQSGQQQQQQSQSSNSAVMRMGPFIGNTAVRQLALLVSYAACQWLPQLSLLTQLAAAEVLAAEAGGDDDVTAEPYGGTRSAGFGAAASGSPPRRHTLTHGSSSSSSPRLPLPELINRLVLPLVSWLPVLGYRACGGGSDGGGGGGGCSSRNGTDGGCWLQLLRDVGAVPLLGAVLRLAAPLAEVWSGEAWRGLPLWSLAESCYWVAAAYGGAAEVRQQCDSWRPELLRALLPYLRQPCWGKTAEATEALAAQLEAWAVAGAVGTRCVVPCHVISGIIGPSGGAEPYKDLRKSWLYGFAWGE